MCGRRFDAPDEGPKQALPTAVSKAPITLLMRVEIADDTLTTAHMMGMSNVMIGTQTKRRETTTQVMEPSVPRPRTRNFAKSKGYSAVLFGILGSS